MSARTEPPSPLALKLAVRFCPRKADAAAQIDNVLLWHAQDERQRQLDAAKLEPSFDDNTLVKGSRYSDHRFTGNEFLALSLAPPEEDLPYTVQLKRYCVPGRCWTYGFAYVPAARCGIGPRITYGSEGTTPLPKALAMVTADLDKPRVVELCVNAVRADRIASRYGRDLMALLDSLAPRSKTARKVGAVMEELRAERQARFEAARAARQVAEVKP